MGLKNEAVTLEQIRLVMQEMLNDGMAQMKIDLASVKDGMATKSDLQQTNSSITSLETKITGIERWIEQTNSSITSLETKMENESQQTNFRMSQLEDLKAYAPFRGNAPPEINRAPSGSGFLEPRSTWRRELPFRK